MAEKKKFYAYFLPGNKAGVVEGWDEAEKFVKGTTKARYKGFATKKEAEDWLRAGAVYETYLPPKLKKGIYFDAGTGRGEGVEISVTNEKGENLLHKVLAKKKISQHGKHNLGHDFTNNYGELLASKHALEIAIKEKIKNVFGDSRLVLDYWSKGHVKKNIPDETKKLAKQVAKLREKFEKNGGKIQKVSGRDNPADLGFHK